MLFRKLLVLFFLFNSYVSVAEESAGLNGVISYTMPNFPVGLRGIMAGDGEVVVAVTLDEQGEVTDSVTLLATNEAFSRSALDAVGDWKFLPAASETWPRREILQFDFKRSGVVTSLSHEEAAREGFASTAHYQISTVQWQELDSEPQRLAGTMPKVSKSALDAHGKQALVINFVIDTDGKVRVPVAFSITDKSLATSVLNAVRTWQFTPPVHDNKPVLVEVTRALVLADSGS